MVASQERLSLTTHIPGYDEVRFVINFLDNKSSEVTSNLLKEIREMRGNPQNNFNFLNPDKWIEDYLKEKKQEQELAMEFWQKSDKKFNPSRLNFPLTFSKKHGLLEENNKIYKINNIGKEFTEDNFKIIKKIDIAEGLNILLNLVNKIQPCRTNELLPQWERALIENDATLRTQIVIQHSLTFRLTNLRKRNLIERKGITYSVVKKENNYLSSYTEKDIISEQVNQIKKSIKIKSMDSKILNEINEIEPEKFEHFIKDLLGKMKYEEAEVTSRSADGGIDIIAKKTDGITELNYVFQVKRWRNSIQRPEIQKFSGAMDGEKIADVGVFVTNSKFSKGAKDFVEGVRKRGNKVITLIGGEELVELMKNYEFGVEKRAIYIYYTDKNSNYFKQDLKKTIDESESQRP